MGWLASQRSWSIRQEIYNTCSTRNSHIQSVYSKKTSLSTDLILNGERSFLRMNRLWLHYSPHVLMYNVPRETKFHSHEGLRQVLLYSSLIMNFSTPGHNERIIFTIDFHIIVKYLFLSEMWAVCYSVWAMLTQYNKGDICSSDHYQTTWYKYLSSLQVSLISWQDSLSKSRHEPWLIHVYTVISLIIAPGDVWKQAMSQVVVRRRHKPKT